MTTQSLRNIDRFVLLVIAVTVILNGMYFAGPWYIERTDADSASLLAAMQSEEVVNVIGLLYITTGAALAYYVSRTNALLKPTLYWVLAIVIIRAFTLSGAMATRDSFLPPSYLANICLLIVCGGYWLYIKSLIRARVD